MPAQKSFMRTPDGHGRLELSRFLTRPVSCAGCLAEELGWGQGFETR
jgi:hypothetical protein